MNQLKEGSDTERSFTATNEPIAAGVNHVAFSRDGSQMAISRTDMSIEISKDGVTFRVLTVGSSDEKVRPTQRIRGLEFGSSGDRLIVASADQVRCVPLSVDAPAWTVVPQRSFGFLVTSPLAVAVSADDRVAAAFDDGSLGVWWPDGECVYLRKESNAPRSLSFALSDAVTVGTDGFSIGSWAVGSGRPVLKRLLDERAFASAYSPSHNLIAVRTMNAVIGFDIVSGEARWRVATEVGLPLLAFETGTGRLAIPDEHGLTIVNSQGQSEGRQLLSGAAVTAVAFNPASREIVLGLADGSVQVLAGDRSVA